MLYSIFCNIKSGPTIKCLFIWGPRDQLLPNFVKFPNWYLPFSYLFGDFFYFVILVIIFFICFQGYLRIPHGNYLYRYTYTLCIHVLHFELFSRPLLVNWELLINKQITLIFFTKHKLDNQRLFRNLFPEPPQTPNLDSFVTTVNRL